MKNTAKNAKGPIDIAKAKAKANAKANPKPKTNTAPSGEPRKRQRTRKHKLAPGQHPSTVHPVFTDQQTRVLDLLATGSSIAGAAEAVGYTHWALQKWMQRDKVFEYYANRARGVFTIQIDDAFHEVETDARIVLHEIIRDQNVAPHVRLRASLAALRRKADEWLPRPLTPTEPILPPPGWVPPEPQDPMPEATCNDPAPDPTVTGPTAAPDPAAPASDDSARASDPAVPASGQSQADSDADTFTTHADNFAARADNSKALYLIANQSLPSQTMAPNPLTNFQNADNSTATASPESVSPYHPSSDAQSADRKTCSRVKPDHRRRTPQPNMFRRCRTSSQRQKRPVSCAHPQLTQNKTLS